MVPVAPYKPLIFISYSHADVEWKNRLVTHLQVLKQEGLVDVYTDDRIDAGSEWQPEIATAIESAVVAVLLISAEFLGSDFILHKEVPRLLELKEERGLRIFPVIIKPCPWLNVGWLRRMQVRPRDARPLSSGSEDERNANLTAIVAEVYRCISSGWEHRADEIPTLPPDPDKISVGKLPQKGRYLFGREQEMGLLDKAWATPKTNIVTLVAWGGVGKSTLINHWLDRMAQSNYRGAERVYAWSFYRQGIESRMTAADEFIADALKWFGDSDPAAGKPWDKGERLAGLVRIQKTLLVLDGIEPLLGSRGQDEGKLTDLALKAFLKELAAYNSGMCLISSRFPLVDLSDYGARVIELNLDHLSPAAGAELLGACGVRGARGQMEQAAREFKGHALTLTLLGTFLNEAFGGDISRLPGLPVAEAGETAFGVVQAYEHLFGEGPELSVLRLLGFFDRPVEWSAIEALTNPVIPGLTDSLAVLQPHQWRRVLSRLRRVRLIAEADPTDPDTLDVHPLVRAYFARQLITQHVQAWREGCDRLFEYYRIRAEEFPGTVQELEPLLLSVLYGCRAGRHSDALHEVYLPRIMRGDQAYAARALGAYGTLLSVLAAFFEGGNWSRPVKPAPPTVQGLAPEDQLKILSQVVHYLMVTQGYASGDVRACFARMEELCTQLGKRGLLFTVRMAKYRSALVTSKLSVTFSRASDLLALAQEQDEPALFTGAYGALATTMCYMGRFAEARAYTEKGLGCWDTQRPASTVGEFFTPITTNLVIQAITSCHFGFPGEARAQVGAAVRIGREHSDLNALAVALYGATYVHQFCRDARGTLALADDSIRVCSAQGFTIYLAVGKILKGWAVASTRSMDEGLLLVEEGIGEFVQLGAGLNMVYFKGLLAELLIKKGDFEKVGPVLDEAERYAARFEEQWWMAEIHRMRGEVLRRLCDPGSAMACFDRAVHLANSQGSIMLYLRAALSKLRLLFEQGSHEEARGLMLTLGKLGLPTS